MSDVSLKEYIEKIIDLHLAVYEKQHEALEKRVQFVERMVGYAIGAIGLITLASHFWK